MRRVLIMAPVEDATAMAALLYADGFRKFAPVQMNVRGKSLRARARYCSRRKRWSPTTFESFGSLKRSPPGQLPLVILTSGGESRRARLWICGCGCRNCHFARAADQHPYARPVMQVALRSRRRQTRRDLVIQLKNLNETLEQRVANALSKRSNRRRNPPPLGPIVLEEAERRRIGNAHEDLQQLLVAARMQLAALCRTQDTAGREPIAREIADL